MSKSVFISIIMPNYNGEHRLRATIESFLAQEYEHKELIVVDGKSTDTSHSILESFHSCAQVRWIKTPDKGAAHATNMGIQEAKGEIIGYLGDDDDTLPGTYEKIAWLAQRVDFDALFFNSYTYFVPKNKCILQKPVTQEITKETLLKHGTIVGSQNTFYRRRVFSECHYDESNHYSFDYELLLHLVSLNPKRCFVFSEHVATLNYLDGDNISFHNDPRQQEKATHEAVSVALKYAKNYSGDFWFSAKTAKKRSITKMRLVRTISRGIREKLGLRKPI
jgi:glycosyltransferase involved in cell wall biosynthesis